MTGTVGQIGCVACALVACFGWPAAAAQPRAYAFPQEVAAAGDPAAKLVEMTGRLDAPEYAARERAAEAILADDRITLPMLETVLRGQTLSLEARERLATIARQRFWQSPRAAIGVQFGGNLRSRTVIGATFEGFDSHRLLEPGDLILSVGGNRIEGVAGRNLLMWTIVSHDPGDVIPLTIRRGAEKLEINITLGQFSSLPQSMLDEQRLTHAWRLRCERLLNQNRPAPISCGIAAAAWPEDVLGERTAQRVVNQLRRGQEPTVLLAGGGMPRAAAALDGDLDLPETQFVFVQQRPGGPLVPRPVFLLEDPEEAEQLPTLQEELDQLTKSKAKILDELKILEENKDNPEFGDARAKAEQREQRTRALLSIEKQRQAIEAEAREAAAQDAGTTFVPVP